MRSISLLMLLISLSACIAKPKPKDGPECLLITVPGMQIYLHCKDAMDTNKPTWEEPLPPTDPNKKFVCTDLDTYVANKKYAKDLNEWINMNCKQGGQ